MKKKIYSKHDFVKVKVMLEDHYYIFSRFLVSRILTLIKVRGHFNLKNNVMGNVGKGEGLSKDNFASEEAFVRQQPPGDLTERNGDASLRNHDGVWVWRSI